MSRPPYLRWFAAIAVLVGGFIVELAPQTSVPVPIALTDFEPGTTISDGDVGWADGSSDIFEGISLPAVAGRTILAGQPIMQADVAASEHRAPEDWWQITLAVPPDTKTGTPILAVVTSNDRPAAHRGVVVSHTFDDGFGDTSALVAFPPNEAVEVAAAVSENRITVLIGA